MKRAAAVIVLAALLCAVCCAQAAGDITVYWEGKPVTVKTPGSYQSVIRVDGHERTVLSSELTWDSSTDLRFGYIYAPNLGKVNMRMGPRSKATIVLKAETNRVVMIFDRQKEWTGVIYDGKAGYVMNGTLKVIEHPEIPKASATLSFKGKTNVSTKITMRMGGSPNYRAVVGVYPGMPVTLFHKGSGYCEVEINGWHGYVQTMHIIDIVEAEANEDTAPQSLYPEDENTIVEEVDLDEE